METTDLDSHITLNLSLHIKSEIINSIKKYRNKGWKQQTWTVTIRLNPSLHIKSENNGKKEIVLQNKVSTQ